MFDDMKMEKALWGDQFGCSTTEASLCFTMALLTFKSHLRPVKFDTFASWFPTHKTCALLTKAADVVPNFIGHWWCLLKYIVNGAKILTINFYSIAIQYELKIVDVDAPLMSGGGKSKCSIQASTIDKVWCWGGIKLSKNLYWVMPCCSTGDSSSR